MALGVVSDLEDLPGAQKGYFTRAQASQAGVGDFELSRSVERGHIERLDHGVYRVAGAGHDEHAALRVAWLRLTPKVGPRQRVREPRVWVSHVSAASLHGYGVFLADTPTFIVQNRTQVSGNIRLHRRSAGLDRSEYTVVDGFAVTTIERTARDLHQAHTDGGHLGRFIDEAVRAMTVTVESVAASIGIAPDQVEALRAMGGAESSK